MRYRKSVFVMAFATAVALQAGQSAHAKAIKIASCTPTFIAKTAGATYNVVNNLTATGDCIDVTVPGVTINLAGFTLTGNGSGAGINIKSGKSGAYIAGPGIIQEFNIGVSDSANSALIEDLLIAGNTTGGILLSGVDGSVVDGNPSIWFNGVYGILLVNTTNCLVEGNMDIVANGNGTTGYGIWIQNSSTTTTLSHDNVIAGNMTGPPGPATQVLGIWVGYNGTVSACPTAAPSEANLITRNGPVLMSTQIGIGLQCNTATGTTVLNNAAYSSGLFDLYDGNPSCGTNLWDIDAFGTSNQS